MFKRNYCYLVLRAKTREDTSTLIDILENHPKKATHPTRVFGSIDGVAVQMKYKDEKELKEIVDNLKGNASCSGIHHQHAYQARMTSVTQTAIISSMAFALEVYGVTIIGFLAVKYNNLSLTLLEEVIFPSVVPAFAAFGLSLREKLKKND